MDRKSTGDIRMSIGCCLTSWLLKKQTALAISKTEAEYVSTEKACQQALWMKQGLVDYDIQLDDIPIMCDNKGAIDLSKNPMQHSHTKHIEILHHFLRDNVQKGHISIEKVSFVDNIAEILTKPLKRKSFNYLCLGLGMMEHIPLNVEAEYKGVTNAATESARLCNLLIELHVKCNCWSWFLSGVQGKGIKFDSYSTPLLLTTLVYCDNVSAIYLTTNLVQHQRTKHIEFNIHFVHDMVTRGQVRVLHVPSHYQYVNIFTKGLLSALFKEFRTSLSVRPSPAQTAREC
nr:ribonuclease H-like domain-containing protein [Tanacetum cinerariifolium]